MPTNAEVALLGLLAEGPAHAWQLQKQVEHRDMRSWTDLSQSTIYKQLGVLEAAGNVSVADEIAEGRLRKVYSITNAGREALASSVVEILTEPEFPKQRIDIATYNVDQAPRSEVLAALAEYRTKLIEAIDCWRELETYLAGCDCPTHRLAIARRSRRLCEADIEWLDDFVAELEA